MQSIIRGLRWFFTKTYPGGSLFGIPILIPLVFIVFVPLFALTYYVSVAPALGWWRGLLFVTLYIAVLYGSVLAHEFGHAWGTRLVGGESERIIMTPIGGIHMGTGGLQSPRAELIVVALGPAVSIVLAGLGLLGVWLLPSAAEVWAANREFLLWFVLVVNMIATVNVMLTLFNLLLPLFPMDGARLLRGGLSLRYNPRIVTHRITQIGVGVGIALLIFLFIGVELPLLGRVSAWLATIGLLGIFACLQEQDRVQQMDVYMRSDNWGGRTVFYDQEIVSMARARAEDDLRGLIGKRGAAAVTSPGRVVRSEKRAKKKAPERSGPARVIDIAQQLEPEEVSDPVVLRDMMTDASNREDFHLAARIQKRLQALRKKEDDEG